MLSRLDLLTRRRGAIVTVVFSGTLQSASNVPNGVAAGDTITGTVAYNTAQSETGNSGLYTFTGSSNTHAFSFQIYPPNTTVANQTEANRLYSDSYSGESTSPFKAQVSYSSTAGPSVTISGDTGAANTGTFSLKLTDPTNTVPSGTSAYSATNLSLPTTTVMQHFVTTQATLAYTDGFLAQLTDFQIYDNYSDGPSFYGPTGPPVFTFSVPEPSGLLLAIIGTLTSAVGYSIARRRHFRAIQED